MKVTILGSGTSHGVPVLGCSCPVCKSTDKRDIRYRSAIYVEGDAGEKIVVDTGPEFRLQAIRAGITSLDAVLLTHSHSDHLDGIADLRPLTNVKGEGGYKEKPMPVYANEITSLECKKRFSWIWDGRTQKGGGLPHINPILVSRKMMNHGFNIGKIKIRPIPIRHGRLIILGWKFTEGEKRFVYLTDTNKVPYMSYLKILKADVLVINALRMSPHATHFSFGEAMHFAKRIWNVTHNLREVYLTHICHENSHTSIEEYCAKWKKENNMQDVIIAPSYDTMTIMMGNGEQGTGNRGRN
jgi:phosphoribosyl 1,2-cyclic phosphate phosphodiesterase